MSNPDSWYQWDEEDLLLNIRVQPKASRDEIVGPYGNALKVRITATPVDGKANNHLIAHLASLFGVAKSRVELLSGEHNRNKRLRILSPNDLPLGISRD